MNCKTHWALTQLRRPAEYYGSFGTDSTTDSRTELAARQLVLGDISTQRADRIDWGFGQPNSFDDLVKLKLAVLKDKCYQATELLMQRQAEVLGKRVPLEVMAKNMGLTLITKAKPLPVTKHNYKAKGSIETLKDFISKNEAENAVTYAAAIGKPLFFGSGAGGANPYYDVELHDIEGEQYFTGRDRRGDFTCISMLYALSCLGGNSCKTREDCVKTVTKKIKTMNSTDKNAFAKHCEKYPKISQGELQADYLNQHKGELK